MPTRLNPHQKGILAAVCLCRNLRHRQAIEVDRIDLHEKRLRIYGASELGLE
jgi:hypothetical protein